MYGNAIINFTDDDTLYTRIVEHKYFDMFNSEAMNSPRTVITREYTLSLKEKANAEPYYPVNNPKNKDLYQDYLQLSRQNTKVTFAGCLGLYCYLDMDEVIYEALKLFRKMIL